MTIRSHSEFISTFSNPASLLKQPLDFNPKTRVTSWLSDQMITIVRLEFDRRDVELHAELREQETDSEGYDSVVSRMVHMRAERKEALENIAQTVNMAWPNFDPNNVGFVKLWIDEKGRVNGRKGRVLMRAGKAFKKMFPSLNDVEIQTLVDQYLDKFRIQKLTLKTSKASDDFRHAYAHTQAAMQNPSTTYSRKAMANSCMRHSFDHLPNHPAEAYGSGDFMIVWTENEQGHIASRCVVCIKDETHACGPIYGTSEQSIDMIEAYIRENEITFNHDDSWIGAKMKTIPHSGGYVLPYLDLDPKWYSITEDDTIVIGEEDDYEVINGSCYSGLLYSQNGRYSCCCCDTSVNEDDVYYDDNGDSYCDNCYSETYFHCGHCSEDCRRDQIVEVHFITRHGSQSECWCDYCANDNAVECTDGQTWALDDATLVGNSEWVSPEDIDVHYFVSDWDGEYHPIDTQIEISINGSELFTESVSSNEVDDLDTNYTLINGVYHKKEEKEESENEQFITEDA